MKAAGGIKSRVVCGGGESENESESAVWRRGGGVEEGGRGRGRGQRRKKRRRRGSGRSEELGESEVGAVCVRCGEGGVVRREERKEHAQGWVTVKKGKQCELWSPRWRNKEKAGHYYGLGIWAGHSTQTRLQGLGPLSKTTIIVVIDTRQSDANRQ